MKKSSKPVCTMTKPEAPASRLPGSAQSEVILAGRELRRRERGHVGNEHDLREGIGQALDADSDGEGEEVDLAGPSQPGETQM